MRRTLLALTLSAGLVAAGHSTAVASPERADVMEQGGTGVRAADGARLVRQTNGIAVSMTMPAPAPDTYVYPEGTVSGHPEVFTLWAFVFNHPELCTDGVCDMDDTMIPEVGFGAYNVAGHVNSGTTLNLSGRIGVGDPAGGPPGTTMAPLSNPGGADVHLAITSHGALDPSTLPGEFRRPTGSPMCGCWWLAIFD